MDAVIPIIEDPLYPNPDDADDEVSLPKYLTLQTGHQILKEWNLQKNQSFVDLS